jgi:hypothetical protein
LLAWKDAIVNLTADDRTLIRAESHVATLLETLPEHSSGLVSWDQQSPLINEGLVIPTQVNYVGKAASLYNAGYELNGSVYVISKFIGNTGYGIGFVSAVVLMEAFVTLSHSGSFSCLTHVSMSVECMGWSSTGDTNAYLISRILYILTCMPRLGFVSYLKAYLHTSNFQGYFLSSHQRSQSGQDFRQL